MRTAASAFGAAVMTSHDLHNSLDTDQVKGEVGTGGQTREWAGEGGEGRRRGGGGGGGGV